MADPRFTEDDVGAYYQDEQGDVWRLVSFVSAPTVEFERLEPFDRAREEGRRATRFNGVVGMPGIDGFRKLVPEEPLEGFKVEPGDSFTPMSVGSKFRVFCLPDETAEWWDENRCLVSRGSTYVVKQSDLGKIIQPIIRAKFGGREGIA